MTVRRLFIISSLSGAGRTTALGVLSDLGFQTSDSVPVSLWPDLLVQSQAEDIALGWPIKAGGTAWHDEQLVQSLSATLEVRHLFLSADRETLQRRYSETRRAHPFDRGTGLMDALTAEQEASLLRRALTDEVVDTTGVKLADLRQSLIAMTGAGLNPLQIRSLSFSYRLGLPSDADMVFDVRWLRNPHYDLDLRPRTGQDEGVGAYIQADEGYAEFERHLRGLLQLTAVRQQKEGKAYFTLAFGCTGGKHRSVWVAEQAGGWLQEAGFGVSVMHRDVKKF